MAASVWIAPRMALPFGEGISLPNPLTTYIITTNKNSYDLFWPIINACLPWTNYIKKRRSNYDARKGIKLHKEAIEQNGNWKGKKMLIKEIKRSLVQLLEAAHKAIKRDWELFQKWTVKHIIEELLAPVVSVFSYP